MRRKSEIISDVKAHLLNLGGSLDDVERLRLGELTVVQLYALDEIAGDVWSNGCDEGAAQQLRMADG